MHAPLVAAPVAQDLLEQHAALDLRGDITVVGYEQVFGAHREPDAGADCLLAFARRVSAHCAGALQVDRGPVEQPGQQHHFVEVAKRTASRENLRQRAAQLTFRVKRFDNREIDIRLRHTAAPATVTV